MIRFLIKIITCRIFGHKWEDNKVAIFDYKQVHYTGRVCKRCEMCEVKR